MKCKNDLPFSILITDVDGVLTDGSFFYNDFGKQYKRFGPHDADAIKFFKSMGVEVFAISADKRGFSITARRLKDMGVEVSNVSELSRLNFILEKKASGRVAFIGDGYFDIPSLKAADIGYTPENAPQVVKNNSDIVLNVAGGNGALLAVFEHFLSLCDDRLLDAFNSGDFKYE